MAFFSRDIYGTDPSFTPLFRLLDDFDSYSREVQGDGQRTGPRHMVRSFNPKFDVRETDTAYELHGELPGIERNQVHIEFTEPQTVVIRGRIERSYTSGTPPAGLVEGTGEPAKTITEGESHKARVEDEAAEKAEKAEKAKEEGKAAPEQTQVGAHHHGKQAKPTEKYWVSERSIGEFSRTFNFPTRVDQEAVSANLNNGVLSVTIPKAKKHESRRIAIN